MTAAIEIKSLDHGEAPDTGDKAVTSDDHEIETMTRMAVMMA